jgi:hypothetical protein
MCNQWCLEFSKRALGHLGSPSRMLEVGSLDVNGTVRSVLGHAVSSYYGVDIRPGPGVDEVLDVAGLRERFGEQAFDLVATTEMLEHCFDWQGALFQILSVLRPGGLLLLTTRSPGFPLHDHPADYWRFEKEELARLLEPVGVILELEDDFSLGWPCGVGTILRRRADGPPLGDWLAGIRRHRVVAVDPVRDAFSPANSHFMPFHEYSPHRAGAEIIGALGSGRPRVLDLGGGAASRLALCGPRLEVRHRAVAVGPEADAGAAAPSRTAEEAGYDCAVAIDTLERLPASRRDGFLEEMAAAAKTAVIVIGAFAEAAPLPSLTSTVAGLERRGFEVAVSANGHRPWLVPLRELWRHSEERPGVLKAAFAPLLAHANQHLAPLDHLEPAYRRVVVGVRGVAMPALPTPSADAYREAERRWLDWQAKAAPLLESVSQGSREE